MLLIVAKHYKTANKLLSKVSRSAIMRQLSNHLFRLLGTYLYIKVHYIFNVHNKPTLQQNRFGKMTNNSINHTF